MNCHATRAVLDLYAEGRLTPRRAKAVAAHRASCAACSAPAAPAASAPAAALSGDFKARLAAAMKAERAAPGPRPSARLELPLWPRDLRGVAVAAAALALIAVMIGWSGAPSQQYDGGDELAAGRMP